MAEGGNLGLTQAARIEYALGGGLVNTDFIDNSAGVDTSDHEVNIKILLSVAASRQAPDGSSAGSRALLHEMTDEVAAHVLGTTTGRTWRWPSPATRRPGCSTCTRRYLRRLVRDKRLSLEADVLPGDKEIAARRSAGTGLTTPSWRCCSRTPRSRPARKCSPPTCPTTRTCARRWSTTSPRRCGPGSASR